MNNYQSSERAHAWKKKAADLIRGQRTIFGGNSGNLSDAFADCMSLIGEPFTMVESDWIKLVQGKTFIGILGHAYQLLLSAWIDNEEGRLAASSDHWRSILESPDYLLAVWWNEDFAKEWANVKRTRTIDVENAMKVVRKALNDRQKGLGDQRDKNRRAHLKDMRPFSHVSVDAAGFTLAHPPGAQGGRFVVPEGYNGPENIETAAFIVRLAREVLAAMGVSIDEVMPQEWRAACRKVYENTGSYLNEVESILGIA